MLPAREGLSKEISMANLVGTPEVDRIVGTEFFDIIFGLGGDDELSGLAGNDVIYGNAGSLGIPFTGSDNDTIRGDSGNDVLFGEDGDDRLRPGTGDDIVFGGNGNDVIDEESALGGNDFLSGDDGDDTIRGFFGNDTILGGQGSDHLDGGVRSDFLDGGDDADHLIGGRNDDTLIGGNGVDDLDGGMENDTLDGGPGVDFLNGGEGSDTATYASSLVGIAANLRSDRVQFRDGTVADDLSSIENLIGTRESDIISGDFDDNMLDGADGDDIVGDTNVFGGNDTVFGGAGRDLLQDGGGDDTFTGGPDADRFLFSSFSFTAGGLEVTPFGRNTITDFEKGSDRIEVIGFNLSDGFGVFDSNNNNVLDDGDDQVSVTGSGDTVIDFSSLFSRDAGTATITVVGVTGLDSNDLLFFF
jgi:Ca2+-binding RTX toxin-like protein